MSYTIYFSVTRFKSETFAYVSSQGEEGRFIRKQLIVHLMRTNIVCQSEALIHQCYH